MRHLGIQYLCIALLMACIGAGDASAEKYDLTEKQASQIINQHFGEFYKGGKIGTGRFEGVIEDEIDRFNKLLGILKTWKRTGLIDYKAYKRKMGIYYEIVTTLTPKGRSTYHVTGEDNDAMVHFVAGKRKLIDIVKIDADGETVYFSYAFEPNELGVLWGHKPGRFRGKAKIVLDAFLKKYVFKGVMISDWEREKWRSTVWSYEIDGKRVSSAKTE